MAKVRECPLGSPIHLAWATQFLRPRGKGEQEVGSSHVPFPADRGRQRFLRPLLRQLPVFTTAACGVNSSWSMPRATVFPNCTVFGGEE